MIRELLILIWSVMLAVLIPQLVGIVLFAIYRLLEQGVQVPVLILICAWAATMTTFLLYCFDDQMHHWIDTVIKPSKTGAFARFKKRCSTKLASVSKSFWFRCGITIGSASIIPDLVLIEISRERMKKRYFFLAIMTGKIITYSILIGGAVWVFETIKTMFLG